MTIRRTLSLATVLVAGLSACAQTPMGDGAHHPPVAASAPGGMADRMAMMDLHMAAMREMHDKMSRARTPEERQALMADHMKLMQEGMNLMAGMGPGGMKGMGGMGMGMGMGDMQGSAATPADPAARHQMMEKRMEMMQSMMQMMMDRTAPPAVKP